MTEYQTHIRRDYRKNWKAETRIDLGDKRELKISTHKTEHGALITHASVGKREGPCVTHALYEDFSTRLAAQNVRCTEKNVREQHEGVMRTLDSILAAVAQHYALKADAA
jgi:hypothetical protein